MRLELLSPLTPAAVVVMKTSLLLACGAAAGRALHRAPAGARHLVWLTVIVGALLVPVFDRYLPLRLPVLPATGAAFVPPLAMPGVAALQRTTVSRGVVNAPAIVVPPVQRVDIAWLLLGVWAIGALFLTARLVVGLIAVHGLIRRARPMDSSAWSRALGDAARRLSVRELPRLVMSDEVEMAFTFDTRRPAIVVPAAASEWSDERRRAVLLHELAHVRRRDLLAHAVAALGCVAYWFNPFMWTAARKLRIESELASDEIVLRAGVRPSEYAQHLLDMVTNLGRRAPSVALAMARPREFEGRLVAILDPTRRRSIVAAPQRGAMVALCSMIAISIGAAAPVRRAAVVDLPTNAIVERPSAAPSVPPGLSTATSSLTSRPTDQLRSMPKPQAVRGSGLSRYAIASLLRYGTGSIVNPMMTLLRQADSVQLTGAQADSVATLNRRYMIRLSQIWTPVSAYYSAHAVAAEDPPLNNPDPDAARRTARALIDLLPEVNALLTPEQRGRLSPLVSLYLDPAAVAAAAESPDGLFLPPTQLSGLRGRARGGG